MTIRSVKTTNLRVGAYYKDGRGIGYRVKPNVTLITQKLQGRGVILDHYIGKAVDYNTYGTFFLAAIYPTQEEIRKWKDVWQ